MKSSKKPTYQDLKKLTDELKQSENRFSMLLEASEDMITIHNPNGKYLYYNSPACYPITSKDLVGKMPNDLFDKDTSNTLLNAFKRIKKTGKSETIEVLLDWLGEKKWFSEYMYPIKDANGEVIKIVKVCREINDRKIAEAKLIESKKKVELSEKRFRELYEKSSDAILIIINNTFVDCNNATIKLLKYKNKATFLNTHPSELSPLKQMDGRESFEKAEEMMRLAKEKGTHRFEWTHTKSDGVDFPVEVLLTVISQEEKNEIIHCVWRDITNRKTAEAALINSENQLNEAQKIAHIGSWLFDPTTQKNEWSDEMFHIWGFDPKKGTPKHDSVLKRVHTDDLALFKKTIDKATRGDPYDIELRIFLPNNAKKIIRTICQPVLGDNGELIGLTGTNQDITSQKSFEKAQIKHQRLKAIGEMSSSIAHDFNNSLQQITGNLEVAKFQKDLPDNALDRLNSIGSIIGDIAERVSELQQFGDTEHDEKNAQLIDFNALIEESLNQSRPLWKDSVEKEGLKINIITNFEDIPKIICNNGELKSVVYNLIKNSVEAMPEGGDLIIKTGTKATHVFATFTDTGIGMDEEVKSKVFDPFFSTKGFELGRGLGMSGVYRTIKKYKGDIIVKASEPSKGSTFKITFPIGQQDEIKVLSENEQKDKALYTILWVDDDPIITEDIGELVELIGHKCTIANSGKKALEHLNKNNFDIVFTDIGMPGMSGWELITAIRNTFGNNIKIVTVSGWAIDTKTKEEHAIDFVLQKPFTLEKLEKVFLEI